MPLHRRGHPPHPGCNPPRVPAPTAEELIQATLAACEPFLEHPTLRRRLLMLDIRVREYYQARDTLWDNVDQILTILNEIDPDPDESSDDAAST